LKKKTFDRRNCGPLDVRVKILYSGVCHSDVHQIRSEWDQNTFYPMVPGHEGAGIVIEVGSQVTKFKVGDHAGVGVMVGSCRDCENCEKELQQYCNSGFDASYNCLIEDPERVCTKNCERGELIFGTYTNMMTVREDFVFKIDKSLPLENCGPLLCAGITTWDPLVHFGAKAGGKGFRVGVLGFGGLGHMAMKFAKSFGNEVYALSSSPKKRGWAGQLGVNFILYSDPEEMKKAPKLDLIIDTVSAQHDVDKFIGNCLRTDGILCLVGLPQNPLSVAPFTLVGGRKTFAGSCIGGCKATQEMLDYCAKHRILPEVEIIHPSEINVAIEKLVSRGNPKARYVIDCRQMHKTDWEVKEVDIDPHEWQLHENVNVWPEEANWHAKNPRPKKRGPGPDFSKVLLVGAAVLGGIILGRLSLKRSS